MRHVFPQGKHAARRGMNRKLLQEEYKGGILMIRRTMFVLLSAAFGSGRGLDGAGAPRSSFGHLPPTATLRWRRYF